MQTTLSIPDMTCGSCVRHVRDALTDLPGIESWAIELRQRRVTVQASGPDAVTAAQARLEAQGYPSTIIAP